MPSSAGHPSRQRRCPDCQLFGRSLGLGGCCPECDQPILLAELLGLTNLEEERG
jgi:hypothetical protein